MFSEKAFQAWQARRGEVEDRERQRIRNDVEAEVDATLAQIRREREAEISREQLTRSLRHATVVRQMNHPLPGLTEAQKRERMAEIRRGVERDLAAYDEERQQLGAALGRR